MMPGNSPGFHDTVNGRRSLDELKRRIEKHLQPFFTGRLMTSITTSDVRTYIAQRQSATEVARKAYTLRRKDGTVVTVPEQRRSIVGAWNAEINRELTILKRMFTLAMQADKIHHRPHVPMLQERNTRKGFFELDMLHGVLANLPEPLRPVIEFAYNHRLAHPVGGTTARMASNRLQSWRGPAGSRNDQESRRPRLPDDRRA